MRPGAGAGSRPQLRPSQPARANDAPSLLTMYGMSGAACGARPATAGYLRASAAGGCGPHGSKSRMTHRHSLQNHWFCTLRAIHSSDRPQRLLRATATVRREPWGMPASGRGTGLRPPMPTATTTGPAFASPKPRTVRCTMRIVRAATPCAASKHLPATFEKANFAPEKELKAKGWTENGRNERCGRNPDLPGRRKSCTAQHRIKS